MRAVFLVLTLFAIQNFMHASAQEPIAERENVLETSAPAESLDGEARLRRLDRQILLELVKLAQHNVRYQQSVNHYARWRNFVYPLAQEAAYACFLGYSLTDLSQEARGWNNTKLISPSSIKRGLSSALLGSIMGAGSSMLEILCNGKEKIRSDKMGFSEHASLSFVRAALARVNLLLSERHELMNASAFSGKRRELVELKEELLKFERDRLVFEYKRWNAHARGYAWYKNSFYIINTTVNAARFGAVQLGFKSFTAKKCAAAVGPLLTSSSSLAALGPIMSSKCGEWASRRQENKLAKVFPKTEILSDEEARLKFERLAELLVDSDLARQHGKLLADLVRLREEKLGLDKLIYHQEKNIERLRLVAGQQAKTAPFISSLGLSSGILSTVGYHGFRYKPKINNRLGFAGDTAVIAAEAVALYATPKAALSTHFYERNLQKQGVHPEQLLAKRLEDLQKLESVLVSESN